MSCLLGGLDPLVLRPGAQKQGDKTAMDKSVLPLYLRIVLYPLHFVSCFNALRLCLTSALIMPLYYFRTAHSYPVLHVRPDGQFVNALANHSILAWGPQ